MNGGLPAGCLSVSLWEGEARTEGAGSGLEKVILDPRRKYRLYC